MAIAKKLLSEDQNVVAVARSRQPLEELQSGSPNHVRVLTGDMSDLSLPQKVVDHAVKEFGQLDSIVVNHGTMDTIGKIEDSDIQGWRRLFDVNFFSAVAFVRRPNLLLLALIKRRQKLDCLLYGRTAVPSCSRLPGSPRAHTAAGVRMELQRQQ